MKIKSISLQLIVSALFASICFVSCSEKNGVEEDDNGNINSTQLKLDPGTYKFTVSPMKGKWEAGDQIYIHGSYGPRAQIVTLKSGDISADGKTATAELGEVTSLLAAPDGLYAAFPASAVEQEDGLLESETTFKDFLSPVSVAYLKGDTFVFADAMSLLTFSVTGDYTDVAVGGMQRPGIRPISFTVDYTSENGTFSPARNDGYPFRYATVEDGKVSVWFPGGVLFKGGYSVFIGKGDNWSMVYNVNKDTELAAGTIADLGDITSKLASYTGPAPKMPEKGQRTKYSIKFNELSGICLSKDEDFLWGVGDDGSIAKISLGGELLWEKWIGCDLEAVSRNWDTEDLIVSIEDLYNPSGSGQNIHSYNGIGLISHDGFNAVNGLYRIDAANKYNNAGIEGVTYYGGGLILAGAQANSHLFCIKLDTGEVLWHKMLYNKATISEIADLCYDPLTGWLWVIDSENKKFFALSIDGENVNILGAYSVSEISNPESICVDHTHGCIWVGDDYGGTSYIYKYEFTGLDDAIIH
ncbi:MAG: hypothetical protein K6A64_02620 [Bacteroidales bacterium]|nr:hypothetical protein [Bacteroidales bacterium]